jgi:hypothetical protein
VPPRARRWWLDAVAGGDAELHEAEQQDDQQRQQHRELHRGRGVLGARSGGAAGAWRARTVPGVRNLTP